MSLLRRDVRLTAFGRGFRLGREKHFNEIYIHQRTRWWWLCLKDLTRSSERKDSLAVVSYDNNIIKHETKLLLSVR